MARRFNSELVLNLPDAYSKAEGSNNRKIMDIEKNASEALREAISGIDSSLDLELATGNTLDLYGDMLSQRRGIATDDQFRIMIKSKLMRGRASGDYNSIITAISMIFNCDPSDIAIDYVSPCVVRISAIPYKQMNEQGIDIENTAKIINELMPVGVKMEAMTFEGTFEFVDTEMVYDADAGFGDVEQTIGGIFGLVASGESGNLPI